MAGIIYNAGNANLNPTARHLPVRVGNQFLDSSFQQDDDFQNATIVNTVDNNGTPYGFKMEPAILETTLGDFDNIGSGALIGIRSTALLSGITIVGVNSVSISAQDPTSGSINLNSNDIISFASQQFRFQGTNITQVLSGGNANLHLKVNVNGTNYLIRLELP